MGLFDYVTDLYASLSVQEVEAEGPVAEKSGEQASGKDHTSGGIGSAQQDRGAAVRGGATTKTLAAAGQDENAEEAQANKQDATSDEDSGEKGHTPGEGGQKSGQLGTDYIPNKASEEEEEEEEEEEPEDIKPKLEEECLKSAQCAPAKHHYDECAERVTKQQEENGKADEDCVEEFFHMMHCATQCAAPKLFAALR